MGTTKTRPFAIVWALALLVAICAIFPGLAWGDELTSSNVQLQTASGDLDVDFFVLDVNHGDSEITGACYSDYARYAAGATVSVKVDGKTYKGKVDKKGNFTIKCHVSTKPGLKLKFTMTKYGESRTITEKVGPDERYMSAWTDSVYKNHKIAKVRVFDMNDAVKGDYVTLRIGKRVYKKVLNPKKIKHDRWGFATIKFKVKKTKAGENIKVRYFNRFGKLLQTETSRVWRGDTIRIGDTKREVRMTRGFGDPDHINSTAYSEQWVYVDGSDRLYVYFRNGRVTNWSL